MFGKQKKYSKGRKSARGQGVIEYAGALVIAAVIIAAGIIVVPPSFASLISTICTNVGTYLNGEIENLG